MENIFSWINCSNYFPENVSNFKDFPKQKMISSDVKDSDPEEMLLFWSVDDVANRPSIDFFPFNAQKIFPSQLKVFTIVIPVNFNDFFILIFIALPFDKRTWDRPPALLISSCVMSVHRCPP